MSTLWEDTDDCAKQYMRAVTIYLMTVLSYSYGIVLDCTLNAPVHENNAVDGLNSTEKLTLKGKM